jgi:hypothetical protein
MVAIEEKPARSEQADMVAVRRRYKTGNKVGIRRSIPDSEDDLPTSCKSNEITIRADQSFNWKSKPFNVHEQLAIWLGEQRDRHQQIQL